MKTIGKVIDYNGVSGFIIDKNNIKYIFTTKDLIDSDIKSGDLVHFEPELYKTVEITLHLARLISKVNK